MTDPFPEFLEQVDRADVAGYFEASSSSSGGAGWAVSFSDPDEVISVGQNRTVPDITAQFEDFARGSPGSLGVGYWGFDAFGLFEPLLRRPTMGGPFPLAELALVRRVRRMPVPRRPTARRAYPAEVGMPRSASLPRSKFVSSVQRLRRAIRAGEAYQVVLANRRAWDRPDDLWDRARALRQAERYAFFYALKFRDRFLVGASPEAVLEVSARQAVVNPIAGTRPLGSDAARRLRLDKDPKELAEHRMLVDLARNDLGRVSVPGGVRLLTRERLTRYAQLEHLVSRVQGHLRPGVTSLEALAAAFPAGTVSGAPKIRATELLRREERTWRGPYGGAVGVMDGAGNATWALMIRSCFGRGSRLFTAAGAGIVYPSEPDREYRETLTKLAQLERVMVGVRR